MGLQIESQGNVTLDSILAKNNSTYAARVETAGSVTLLGSLYTNQFSNSAYSGLVIMAGGAVTLNKLSAVSNGSYGVAVTSGGKLTIADAATSNNASDGVYAEAGNGAAITNLVSYNNGSTSPYNGIHLIVSAGAVSFAKSSFIGNASHGIWVEGSKSVTGFTPVVTLTGTTYYGNDADKSGAKNILVDHQA